MLARDRGCPVLGGGKAVRFAGRLVAVEHPGHRAALAVAEAGSNPPPGSFDKAAAEALATALGRGYGQALAAAPAVARGDPLDRGHGGHASGRGKRERALVADHRPGMQAVRARLLLLERILAGAQPLGHQVGAEGPGADEQEARGQRRCGGGHVAAGGEVGLDDAVGLEQPGHGVDPGPVLGQGLELAGGDQVLEQIDDRQRSASR